MPTIVGGRPPQRGRGRTRIPRGIEVLVKKASVDPQFREVLLDERAKAAREIALELSPVETATLNSVARAQIEKIIESTTVEVPEKHRKYFDLVTENPDIFPGFFHAGIESNVLPKLELLRELGFYPQPEGLEPTEPNTESCGAHSPRVTPQELATRA